MVSLVLLLLNTLAAIYYAKKRWHWASIMFVLSSFVLFGLSLFMARVPLVTDGIISLIGVGNYLLAREVLLVYSAYAVSPYFAIVILAVVATIVVTLDTAATLLEEVKRDKPQRVAQQARALWRLRSVFCQKRKTYLSFCSMLC